MKEINLTQGHKTQVDDWNYEHLNQWKWHVRKCHNTYYATRNSRKKEGEKRRTILMHNEIMKNDGGIIYDHQDRNGLNNMESNLRKSSYSLNNANREKRKGKSKYRGVRFISGKYIESRISVNGETIRLGMCSTEEEAARKYDEAAKKYFGEFANLNF